MPHMLNMLNHLRNGPNEQENCTLQLPSGMFAVQVAEAETGEMSGQSPIVKSLCASQAGLLAFEDA